MHLVHYYFSFVCRRSTKSPLYVEPYENFGPLDTSAIGSSVYVFPSY